MIEVKLNDRWRNDRFLGELSGRETEERKTQVRESEVEQISFRASEAEDGGIKKLKYHKELPRDVKVRS